MTQQIDNFKTVLAAIASEAYKPLVAHVIAKMTSAAMNGEFKATIEIKDYCNKNVSAYTNIDYLVRAGYIKGGGYDRSSRIIRDDETKEIISVKIYATW